MAGRGVGQGEDVEQRRMALRSSMALLNTEVAECIGKIRPDGSKRQLRIALIQLQLPRANLSPEAKAKRLVEIIDFFKLSPLDFDIETSTMLEQFRAQTKDIAFITDGLAWRRVGAKEGGANVSKDKLSGRYEAINADGETITTLFKQDWEGNKLRAEKIIAEGAAGMLMRGLCEKVGINPATVADVKLVPLSGAGATPHVQSTYIAGYQDDLWLLAYARHFEFKKNLPEKKANDKAKAMTRPSGVAPWSRARPVINAYLLSDPQLLSDFSHLAVMRMWLGDMGVHGGNFGVTEIDEKKRLAALDFGAAFLNLTASINPFDKSEVGLPTSQGYKHHFLEYGDIYKSEQMAEALMSLAKLSAIDIRMEVDKVINEIAKVSTLTDLQAFCKRMRMEKNLYDPKNITVDTLKENMRQFMGDRLVDRRDALVEVGIKLGEELKAKNDSPLQQWRSRRNSGVNESLNANPIPVAVASAAVVGPTGVGERRLSRMPVDKSGLDAWRVDSAADKLQRVTRSSLSNNQNVTDSTAQHNDDVGDVMMQDPSQIEHIQDMIEAIKNRMPDNCQVSLEEFKTKFELASNEKQIKDALKGYTTDITNLYNDGLVKTGDFVHNFCVAISEVMSPSEPSPFKKLVDVLETFCKGNNIEITGDTDTIKRRPGR